MRLRLRTALIGLPFCYLALASVAAEQRPSIWLAPLDRAGTVNHIGSSDYMDLFQDGASWSSVAPRVSVFKLYPFFVGRSPEADLIAVVHGLASRHIAIALEARGLTDDGECTGDGGDITPRLLRRLKSVGADLKFIALDEPVKHWLTAKISCKASVRRIAANLAANVAKFRAIYPSVEVGDIEPVGDYPDVPNLLTDLVAFTKAYEQASGERLGFFHADVTWNGSWKSPVTDLARRLRSEQVPFGVIVNGTDLAPSDEVWTKEALSHLETLEHGNAYRPDTLVFQSWVDHPHRVLPESDPTTLTGIVNQAFHDRLF